MESLPWSPLMVAWLGAVSVVFNVLAKLRSPRRSNRFRFGLVFMGFLFPVVLAFCLPLDVATARYAYCRLSGSECDPASMLVTNERGLGWTWRIAFYGSLALSWFILPLLQGFVESGNFGVLRRILDTVVLNTLFLSIIGLVFGLFVVYALKNGKPIGQIEDFVMAGTNAFGLSFVMVFMGHGLVELPRRIWRRSDKRKLLKRLEFAAPQVQEEMLEADAQLESIVMVLCLYRLYKFF